MARFNISNNIVLHTFISPKGYKSKFDKPNDKPIDGFIWRKSWNSDLDIIWFHIFRWYLCVQYKNYFL